MDRSGLGSAAERHAATQRGAGPGVRVLLHGFGTDQSIWNALLQRWDPSVPVLRYDQMGSGRSRLEGYDPRRYATLDGYAQDLVDILDEQDARDCVVVGHSVSGMISLLGAKRTDRISRLVMIASSPRYLNDGDYVGGFEVSEIEDLLRQMELDFLGWARALAPAAMANPQRPELGEELLYSFSRANPEILRQFARATFFTDARQNLADCQLPVLVLQPEADVIVPREAAAFLAANLPQGRLQVLSAQGHYPHVSAPDVVAAAIEGFLSEAEAP